MREFGYSLNETLDMGFYEAHRLWNILDELRARELEQLSIVLDNSHATDERRREVINWIKARQPRTEIKTELPPEVKAHIDRIMRGN